MKTIFKIASILIIAVTISGCSASDKDEENDQVERVPTSVTVKKIIISNVPPTKSNGDSWDPSGNPDLAVAIYNSQDAQLWFSGATDEVDLSEELEFICNYKITSNLRDTYRIPLTEWDGNDYDLIRIMEFTPYQGGLGTPDTLVISNILQAKLVMDYSY